MLLFNYWFYHEQILLIFLRVYLKHVYRNRLKHDQPKNGCEKIKTIVYDCIIVHLLIDTSNG